MPKRPSDVVHDTLPTPLPPLASTQQRTPKLIRVNESLISSLEGTLSKCDISYQTRQILDHFFYFKSDGISAYYFYHC